MTATKRKPVDAVLVGVGLTGSLLAKELTDAGLRVVGLERGGPRDTHPDFAMPGIHDELRFARRHELAQDLSRETITFRNGAGQTALPMRRLGSFLPGEGVGGAAVHWNGMTWRFLPWDFETRSRTVARYGKDAIPADCTSADWGVTYAELEPHYDTFEHVFGIGGKAGNLGGKVQPGGNPYEGPRSREYPNPPMKTTYVGALFDRAAEALGAQAVPRPLCEHVASLHQPLRGQPRRLRLLRLLRAFRLRDGGEGEPADHRAARATQEPELRAANARERPARQPRRRSPPGGERHLPGRAGQRGRAAGGPGAADLVRLQQCAAFAPLGHRPALRPDPGRGGRGPELFLSGPERGAPSSSRTRS